MKEIQGHLDARGKRFAIVASRFNEFIVSSLIKGAHGALLQLGAKTESITLFHVPGAFEIPAVAARAVSSGKFDAVICLGAVIRGSTPHFDYVAGESAKGIGRLSQESAIPVIYGVLTTLTIEQAIERAGTKAGNKGADAAFAAVEMLRLYEAMKKGSRPK